MAGDRVSGCRHRQGHRGEVMRKLICRVFGHRLETKQLGPVGRCVYLSRCSVCRGRFLAVDA